MMRFIATTAILALLAACSLNPLRDATSAHVVADSPYCGTASQDSEAHYFADASAFEDWLEYRSISDFSPSLARDAGIIIVEMGQRPTGGYYITLDASQTRIENDTLVLTMTWNAPRPGAAVSQALTAQCVAIRPPQGDYSRIQVVDQLAKIRGQARIN